MGTTMKLVTNLKKNSLIIALLFCLIFILLIQYHTLSNTKNTINNVNSNILQLLKTNQVTLNKKTSSKFLIKTLTAQLSGNIIKEEFSNIEHLVIINFKQTEGVLQKIIKILKFSYIPISEVAIDLLKQTIELRIPIR